MNLRVYHIAMTEMRILLATSNPHKRDEILAVWSDLGGIADWRSVDLVTLGDVTGGGSQKIPEPIEDGATFEDNATIKARHYATATGMLCLADDSGLEVDALGGQPGVHSARFAGVTEPRAAADQANNRLLLEKLQDVPAPKRTARFVCAMALVIPPDPSTPERASPQHAAAGVSLCRVLAVVRGTIEGRIIGPDQPPRGANGFGYDPLFELPDLGQTTAQLSPEDKNRLSHRGKAARLMWQQIQQLGIRTAVG